MIELIEQAASGRESGWGFCRTDARDNPGLRPSELIAQSESDGSEREIRARRIGPEPSEIAGAAELVELRRRLSALESPRLPTPQPVPGAAATSDSDPDLGEMGVRCVELAEEFEQKLLRRRKQLLHGPESTHQAGGRGLLADRQPMQSGFLAARRLIGRAPAVHPHLC